LATKKHTASTTPVNKPEPPATLSEHPFFGLKMDKDQIAFRDAIWNPEKLIVFCDAKAGSGKTQIAVMTAELLYQYRLYDGIVYITAPVQEKQIGFLPGTAQEKMSVYNEPFYQAAIKANININQSVINEDDPATLKNGTGYIQLMSHNFLRGCNFENKVVIIDEAQNFTMAELRKTLTRIHDTCKVIVIGHHGQQDSAEKCTTSAFEKYIVHFSDLDWAAVCHLSKNYRGLISNHADSIEE